MSDPDQSRSSLNKKQNDQINEKLWNDLVIDFHLEAFKFPDNKIYGIVKVIPESSRRLIKKFILVVNKRTEIDFHVSYDSIAASGFNTNTKDPSAYIKAIPNNTKWAQETKLSKNCYFHFIHDDVFALSPTISFTRSKADKNAKADLNIEWFHLGDRIAHKYIMYLDGFENGENHTFQLVAKLLNGKETYQSDLMKFEVPELDSFKNHDYSENQDELKSQDEFITVTNELPPPNLPSIPPTKDDIISDVIENNQEQSPKTPSVLKESPKNDNKMYTCCNDSPHKEFPGIEHYFKNIGHLIPTSPKSSINGNKKSIPPKEKTNNDDDDIVMS
ncbi:unnamed protein product [Adineta steineri]|uniref:Uncharacterized protein n=1 Tax=Adineta steineri TaxID=433720 RepID=A0A815EUG2_9BILA|nr:unnamed protein product [Adineta steineri]CAF1316789.1 unnamed protein product [Adineta steineri]CAF1582596.1 unnamed protein product [Adineta steineri]CAF1582693.1 unnamed protein product [Adineta steineri]